MEKNTETFEKFISYHKGISSDEEKSEVETMIAIDTDAKKEFDEFGLLEKNIRLYYWQKEAEKALKETKIVKLGFSWKKIGIAASLFLISTFLYFSLNKNYLSDIIVEKGVLRSTNTNIPSGVNLQEQSYNLFVIGKANYHAKDFEAAIAAYKTALKTPNLRNQILEAIKWHLCVAYLRNNQPIEAEKVLHELESVENPKYEIGRINKAKVKTQIFLKKLF